MRPHTLVLALAWAYLENFGSSKRVFRVKIKQLRHHKEIAYKATLLGLSEDEAIIEVKFDSTAQILPRARRYECVAQLRRASASQRNVIDVMHPNHYTSASERITFHFTGEKFSFDGQYDSDHPHYDRYFKSWDGYIDHPVGMRTQGYIKEGKITTELEVGEFDVSNRY